MRAISKQARGVGETAVGDGFADVVLPGQGREDDGARRDGLAVERDVACPLQHLDRNSERGLVLGLHLLGQRFELGARAEFFEARENRLHRSKGGWGTGPVRAPRP